MDADTKSGRPKKFINIAMVGEPISRQPNVLVFTTQDVNRKKIVHWNVAAYGLPGSAMIVLCMDRWPNG